MTIVKSTFFYEYPVRSRDVVMTALMDVGSVLWLSGVGAVFEGFCFFWLLRFRLEDWD